MGIHEVTELNKVIGLNGDLGIKKFDLGYSNFRSYLTPIITQITLIPYFFFYICTLQFWNVWL